MLDLWEVVPENTTWTHTYRRPQSTAWGQQTKRSCDRESLTLTLLEKTMWTKPEFTEMRFGFEVTMYIYNR
jgi:pyrroloquinoline quinone biosynthesis protein A